MSEGFGPLDLSDANLEGFAPVDPNRYNCEIVEVTMDATKNPNGKMPIGTPMVKVQFKILDEPFVNRRVFTQFVIPPKDYDASKAATMKGMLARFFMNLGYTEEQVKDPTFNPDFEDLKGMPIVCVVGKEPKKIDGQIVDGEWNNPVKGTKPAGSLAAVGGADTGGLL